MKLDAMLAHYAESHRNPRNELIHCICVPLIVFAVLGMLWAINIGIALLGVAAALIYYYTLGRKPALEMAAMLAVMLLVWGILIPPFHQLLVAIIIFIIAWIGQFVGHRIEGRKPSFLEDIRYLLIGPLFVLAVMTGHRPAEMNGG